MTRMPRSTASVALLALICSHSSVVALGKPFNLLKIQLYKQQQPSIEVPHRLAHQQTRARRRALEETGTVNVSFALSASSLDVGYGTHYAEIYLGIPAQRASVIVDTGSHLTALPCSTCNGCGHHTDPLFDVSKSTTAKYLACHDFGSCRSCEQDRCYISQSYTEGSMWEAVMVDELVWVGGLSSLSGEIDGVLKTFGFRFPVGCQTKETGLFITQKENGIMGLGRHHSTVMSYMLKAGRVTHDIFTLCFAGNGGELVFGGVDYSHHTSAVSYTPLLNDNSASYPVHVKDILVNGVSLGIDDRTINSGRGVIVDSGTTDTFFTTKGNRRFIKAFGRVAGGLDYTEQGMKLSHNDMAALPIITIILSGMKGDGSDDVQLDLPASKYLTLADDGGSYSSNVHFSERSGGVLGAGIMIGLDVIFDTENKRVGFADSHCGRSHRNRSRVSLDTAVQLTSETASPIASAISGQLNASSSSNSLAVESNATSTVPIDSAGSIDITTSSLAGVITRQASPNIGAFIAQVILISLVGIALGVMVCVKWRMRAWTRIPTSAPPADMEAMLNIYDTESQPPSSPSEGSPLRATRKARSPKFTNGSNRKDDDDEGP